MNSYLIFLAGVLFDNNKRVFNVAHHTSSMYGRYLSLTLAKGQKVPKDIEIIEVRAGKFIKRYRINEDQGDRPKDSIQLVGVPNDF